MQRNFCSNCGKPIESGVNFCPYCGAEQPQPAQPLQESELTVPQPPSQPEAPNLSADIIPRRRLPPRAKILFFINYVALTSILIPFIVAFFFFEPIFALILGVAYFLVCYIFAAISYNEFHFTIDRHGFEEDYGMFFKRHVSIPYEHIQNVNTTRSILDHIFGTARIDIETAGSSSPKKREIVGGIQTISEAMLPGLTVEEARLFRDMLLQKVAESN